MKDTITVSENNTSALTPKRTPLRYKYFRELFFGLKSKSSRLIPRRSHWERTKTFFTYAEDFETISKPRRWQKLTALRLIFIFMFELLFSPLSGLGELYAQAFSRREFKEPRGRLENYYNAANSKSDITEWERLVNSGKNLLSSEWESNAQLEIERAVAEELKKEDGKTESELRIELGIEKLIVRSTWENDLNQEIDERKGSWRAKIATESFESLYDTIDKDAILLAISEAEAELKSTVGTVEEKIAKWDSTIKPRLLGIRADWENELQAMKTVASGVGSLLTGKELELFESELAKIEKSFLSYYEWEESFYVQSARQSAVSKLNRESDIDGRLATETDPAEIIKILVERTQTKIDQETGELKEEIIKERETIPLDFSFSDGDREQKILAALDAGQRQWEAAIEDLIVKKLQYDRNVAASRQLGEAEWTKAYTDLLAERDKWLANFQKDLAEGIKAWNESETRLKDNKTKALEELDRYITSRVDGWNSYARGLEGIALSSASTIQTIVESIASLDELLAELPDNHPSRGIYNAQRTGWTALLAKFRGIIATAEAKVHADMRGENGFLNPNSPERILTTAELELEIAKSELAAATKRRDRAKAVVDYAKNNASKTKQEIENEYTAAKNSFLEQQELYSALLQALNGTQGSAGYFGSVDGGTPATATGESILDRLEAARNNMDSFWQTLELARTSMEEARRKYEEASKLQIYVLNRDLLGTEIGVVSSEVDESNPASYAYGLRHDIEKATEQVNNALALIRNREIEVYRQNYERSNAERAREFYTELTKRIVGYETDKETLANLKTLFSSGDTLSQILTKLGNEFVVANIVGSEQESAFRAEVLRLRDLLDSSNTSIPSAFNGWGSELAKTGTSLSGFPAGDVATDKPKLDSYNTLLGSWQNSIPVGLVSAYEAETIQGLLEYSEELSDDWQEEREKVEDAKLAWETYAAANQAFFNGTLVLTETERAGKVVEADIKFREFLRASAGYESFINEILWVKTELNVYMGDIIRVMPTRIDQNYAGTARTSALAAVTEFSRNFTDSKTSLDAMLKTSSESFASLLSVATDYSNKFKDWQLANGKKSGALAEATGFLGSVLQSMENRVSVGKWELDFLLNPDGRIEDLTAKEKAEELKVKIEGAELNDKALLMLKEKIDLAKAAGEEKSADTLRDIYLEMSNALDTLRQNWNGSEEGNQQIFVMSLVHSYLGQYGLSLIEEEESFWTKLLSSSSNLLDFYEDGGTFTPEEIARIKREGTAEERQVLSDSIIYGSGMFFGSFIEEQTSKKYGAVFEFKNFAEGVLSGRILSVLTDSTFANQENADTGILSEFKSYLAEKGLSGDLGTSADYQTGSGSTEENINVLGALREFLIEKSRKGEAVNPAIAQIAQEIGVYTDRISDWEYVLENIGVTQEEADAGVNTALANKKDIEDAVKLFGELQTLLSQTSGDSLYFQRAKVEELVTKLEAVDAKLNFSSDIKEKITAIKDYIWGFYKREIAQAYLTGRALSNKDGKPDDANETFESFLQSIEDGKYFMSGSSGGNVEVSALFFGRTLTASELDEIEEYLRPYESKINIWNADSISDLTAYLENEDEDLRSVLRLQILYNTYENIQNAVGNGYFVNQTKIPVEMREYSLIFAFETYLEGSTDPTEINFLKNRFLLMLSPDTLEWSQTKIDEYLAKPGKRNPNLYLPSELRELAATLDYFYRPAVELATEPPDMAALTSWLLAEGYSADLASNLMGSPNSWHTIFWDFPLDIKY